MPLVDEAYETVACTAVGVAQETVHQHKLEHLENQVVFKEQGHQMLHQELVMREDLNHKKEN